MTPTQREAALRLADDMDTPISVWADHVAHLLRELAAEPVINHKMTTEPAEPHYTITWDAQGRRLVNGELAPEHRTAKPAQQPQGEPVAWHVCSVNSDGSLSLEFAAPWEELAHEHVNDAINEHDIDGAASWVVRPVYASPQPQQTEPSQNTHPPQQRQPLTDYEIDRFWMNRPNLHDGELLPQLRDFARAIERAHGIVEAP